MQITAEYLPRLRIAMQSNEWFKQCDEEFQSALVSMGQIRHLKDGEILKGAGETASGLWCVFTSAFQDFAVYEMTNLTH